MSINLHLSPSDLTYASRILRQTQAVAGTGWFDAVDLVGTDGPNLPAVESVDEMRSARRIPIPDLPGPRAFARGVGIKLWARKVEALYRDQPVACINAHSLTVLPLAVRLKRATGAALIYDTHELETETTSSSTLRKMLAKPLERRYIGEADAVFVVSEGIAEWYREAYGLEDVTVVLNAPSRAEVAPARAPGALSLLREALGVADHELVFVYQGILGHGRAIEAMLDAFREVPAHCHLAVMGFGPLERDVAAAAAAHPTIHHVPAAPPEEIVRWTVGADVGMAIHERASLSYELAMPNKLLRYLACGVPALTCPFPDMERLVMGSDGGPVGWVCAPQSDALRRQVASITKDDVQDRRARLATWTDRISWENEAERMLAAYPRSVTAASLHRRGAQTEVVAGE